MAASLKTIAKPKAQKVKTPATDANAALYLYGITRASAGRHDNVSAEGVDGRSAIEAVRCGDYVCWISRVSRQEFADELSDKMQDLEWLASASLRHQRAVAEISREVTALPARFGTVFLSADSMAEHVRDREQALREAFVRVAEADEWGVKIFAVAAPKKAPQVRGASGADYLKRKAESLRPRGSRALDVEVTEFLQGMTALSVAASAGGKASAGQPGLIWHGSFLVRRSQRKKLDATLKKYAERWQEVRRIDCSGPWPPYSFVGDHAS